VETRETDRKKFLTGQARKRFNIGRGIKLAPFGKGVGKGPGYFGKKKGISLLLWGEGIFGGGFLILLKKRKV